MLMGLQSNNAVLADPRRREACFATTAFTRYYGCPSRRRLCLLPFLALEKWTEKISRGRRRRATVFCRRQK